MVVESRRTSSKNKPKAKESTESSQTSKMVAIIMKNLENRNLKGEIGSF